MNENFSVKNEITEQTENSEDNQNNKERIVFQKSIIDCNLRSVTVFLDKAEICRSIPIQVEVNQCLELKFSHLSPFIDKDSIRVEALGTEVIIQDVTFQSKFQERNKTPDIEYNMLLESEKENIRKKESLNAKLFRLSKQKAILDSFADRLIKSSGTEKEMNIKEHNVPNRTEICKTSIFDIYDPRHMETLNVFFDFYEKKAEKLDQNLFNTKEELNNVELNLQMYEKKLKKLDHMKESMKSRYLSVFIEGKEQVKTDIYLYYVVDHCSWKPSYDIRINNNESKMKITYYAIIQQNTKEDWNDIQELNISTVHPPLGGGVPEMGIQKVCFKSLMDSKSNQLSLRHPTKFQKNQRMSKALSFQEKTEKSNNSNTERAIISKLSGRDTTPCYSEENSPLKDNIDDTTGQRSKHSTLERQIGISTKENISNLPSYSQNKSDMPSAHYSVSRSPGLISTGGDAVKVIIGYLDLTPLFEYTSVPKRAPYAYLKANAVNSSEYVILPGESNVFIDSCFIGKTEMMTVAPGEEFSCHLGADHRIQISYHPMFKYREGSMPISKTLCIVFKQCIEITNNHLKSIKMTLMDHLPITSEEKIKIVLQEPTIKHPEKYDKSKPIRMTKYSQIEWDLEIGSGEKREIILKYTVEYPVGECLDLISE